MEILEAFKEIAYLIIIGAGTAIVGYGLNIINNKIDKEQENNDKLAEQEKINYWIDEGQRIITDAVKYVSQTYVDSLKKAGAFTKEAQVEAKERCIERIKSLLSTEGRAYLTKIYKNLDVYIDTKLEAAVGDNKKEREA